VSFTQIMVSRRAISRVTRPKIISPKRGPKLLEQVGLNVKVANDGAEALMLAKANRYDVILMDMQMPKMNGLDATRAIRSNSANMATPILAMTANAFSEDRLNCLDAGMDDFLSKPAGPDVLYNMLLKWLSR
jgi:CheY-like chemotaxis protein